MRSIATIFRREFTAYFTSPVGYVFLAAFILFTNLLGLFIVQPWFEYPEPSLRMYFYTLLGVSAFFVAAVTMRQWADERRGNTFEMLLTLPMRARELVLGKFLAALAFHALALALTLTVPWMVARVTPAPVGADAFWGGLDTGAIVTAYLGALLAGCVFIAFGLFVSGLCQDQIVAFVLTAPALFLAYLLGLSPIQGMLDSAFEGFVAHGGRKLGSAVGVFEHYENMVRGLVNVVDVLFFLLWTALFLFLNALALERRGRAGANVTLAAAGALVFAIGGIANAGLLSELRLGRVDVTRARVFTVKDVTRRVLAGLENNVHLRYHVTPRDRLPPELQSTEREVVDKLDALQNAAGGRLTYEIVTRHEATDDAAAEGANPDDEGGVDESLEAQAVRRVEPFQYMSTDSTSQSVRLVYSGVEIQYADKATEVLLPQVVNRAATMGGGRAADVGALEFAVVDYIHRATRAKPPVVAVVAPKAPDWPMPLVQQYMQQTGRMPPPPDDPYAFVEMVLGRVEGYDVRRVKLTAEEPLPADADVVVVVAESLNARQVYELSRALASGTPMILAAQRQTMDYRRQVRPVRTRDGGTAHRIEWQRRLATNAVDLAALLPEGARLGTEMLFDLPEHAFTHMYAPGPFGQTAWQAFGALPPHVRLASANFDTTLRHFENVPTLRWPWGATLDLDMDALKAGGFDVQVLAKSNASSWRRLLTGTVVTDRELRVPAPGDQDAERGAFPLIALLKGPFPFNPADRPAWPAPEAPLYGDAPPPPAEESEPAPVASAPGHLLLLADGYLWNKGGIDRGFPPELTFLMNAVALFVMDADELDIRDLRQSTFAPPAVGVLTSGQRSFWKTAQVGGALAFIAVAGLAVWIVRKRRREAYRARV